MKPAILLQISLLAIMLAGCKDEPLPNSEVRPVRTVTVSPQAIEDSRTTIGEIKPRHETDAGFRVSGKLVARLVKVGDKVRKGDVIARIDGEDYENRLRQAAADVKAAEAVLVEATANEARQRKLMTGGYTTKVNYDAAKKGLISAEAALQSARVAAKMAADQVGYTVLHADFDGVITATGAEAGQVVGTGQMIVREASLAERDAVFSIAEADVINGFFAIGDNVSLSLLSDPSIYARGQIAEVSPIADPATRTFQVKATVIDPPDAMLFGSSVSGTAGRPMDAGIGLPPSAVFGGGVGTAVWIYQPASHTVTLRPISIGRYEAHKVVVSDGLASGDIVVAAGVNRLREGQEVKLSQGGAL